MQNPSPYFTRALAQARALIFLGDEVSLRRGGSRLSENPLPSDRVLAQASSLSLKRAHSRSSETDSENSPFLREFSLRRDNSRLGETDFSGLRSFRKTVFPDSLAVRFC